MRLAATLAALLLASCATSSATRTSARDDDLPEGLVGDPAWTRLPMLSPLQVALLHHLRSNTPPPFDELAFTVPELCDARDEEAREAALPAARDWVVEQARAVTDQHHYLLAVRQELKAYDVDQEGFATSFRDGAVVRFGRFEYCRQDLAYLLVFRNGGAFSLLPLPRSQAAALVGTNTRRAVVHDLEVEVVGALPGPPEPMLLVDIVRLRTRDAEGGAVLADSGLDARPERWRALAKPSPR